MLTKDELLNDIGHHIEQLNSFFKGDMSNISEHDVQRLILHGGWISKLAAEIKPEEELPPTHCSKCLQHSHPGEPCERFYEELDEQWHDMFFDGMDD